MTCSTLNKLIYAQGKDDMGARELHRRTGISQATIGDYLKNIGLEPEVQEAIDEQKLPITIGREIAKLALGGNS